MKGLGDRCILRDLQGGVTKLAFVETSSLSHCSTHVLHTHCECEHCGLRIRKGAAYFQGVSNTYP